MGMGEFQTLHLCENPPHAPANSNFILTLIQFVLAFKYHISLKLALFYSACAIDTWPYLVRVSLAFAYDLRRRSGHQGSRHRVQATTSARAWERDKKPFSHNALVRLANLSIEVHQSVIKM